MREVNFETERSFLSLFNKCCHLWDKACVCAQLATQYYEKNKFTFPGLFQLKKKKSDSNCFTVFYSLELLGEGACLGECLDRLC